MCSIWYFKLNENIFDSTLKSVRAQFWITIINSYFCVVLDIVRDKKIKKSFRLHIRIGGLKLFF